MRAGQYVLVHDGASPIGQAAIRVSFAMNAKVVTSVSCDEERIFIKELFPQVSVDLRGDPFFEGLDENSAATFCFCKQK